MRLMFSRITAALLLSILFTGISSAATAFSLDFEGCSNGCSVLPAGTITVTNGGLDTVLIEVELNENYSFRNPSDTNHWPLTWNLSGNPAITFGAFTSSPGTPTFVGLGFGSYNQSPFGTFTYAVDCTTNCVPGVPPTPIHNLSFTITGTGVSESSFIGNAGGYFFAIDVVGITEDAGEGDTGNVAAKGGITVLSETPEPSSIFLLGGGLAALIGLQSRIRRRK